MTEIDLPESLKVLEKGCFQSSAIKQIKISPLTINIPEWFCYGCKNLGQILFNDNIISMGSYAFNGHTSLQIITLPNSLNIIGNSAFVGTSLRKIIIPEKVQKIGSESFKKPITGSAVPIQHIAFLGTETTFPTKSYGEPLFEGNTKELTIYCLPILFIM